MNPTIKNHSENIKGYKAMKKDSGGYYTDGMGRGKKTYFKKGQIVEVSGEPILCQNGIHFFRHMVFAINFFENGNPIWEVESLGNVQEDTEKCMTTKIKIIRKLTNKDIISIIDDTNNSGNMNSGNRNSGDWNSGDMNSGNMNSGDMNSGDWNSGDWNSGNFNSSNGYKNYFCTNTKYFLFDIEVKEIPKDIKYLDMDWFELEEKGVEGYKKAWSKCPEDVLKKLKSIPEFKLAKNKKKFLDITGIKI